MTTAATPELHLPDLPEVQLGGSAPPAEGPRPRRAWRHTWPQAVASYLPLLLMALLAAGTWWLVKNTPVTPGPAAQAPARQEPDYLMQGFSITRFDREGRVMLRIDGDQMRHFPMTDRLEIDGVRVHAVAPDGRTTDASALRAVANGDGSEVQLLGQAQVRSQIDGGQVLQVQGEFLHAFLRFERLRSHLPVRVQRADTVTTAGGLDYDHVQRTLQLTGPVRSTFSPAGRPVGEPADGRASP